MSKTCITVSHESQCCFSPRLHSIGHMRQGYLLVKVGVCNRTWDTAQTAFMMRNSQPICVGRVCTNCYWTVIRRSPGARQQSSVMQIQLIDMRLSLMLLELNKGVQPSFIGLQQCYRV